MLFSPYPTAYLSKLMKRNKSTCNINFQRTLYVLLHISVFNIIYLFLDDPIYGKAKRKKEELLKSMI